MSNQKTIYVPRGDYIKYMSPIAADDDGKLIEVECSTVLQPNREYTIGTKDGNSYNVTVSGIRTVNSENGAESKKFIKCTSLIQEGFENVIRPTDMEIPIDDICQIDMIHSCFIKERRTYQESTEHFNSQNNTDVRTFTFSFNTMKYATMYRLTIYAGEFISAVVRDEKSATGRNVIYGQINDYDEMLDKLYITEYKSDHGIRSVENVIIDNNKLLGIYKYRLKIEPYDPNVPKKRADKRREKREKALARAKGKEEK